MKNVLRSIRRVRSNVHGKYKTSYKVIDERTLISQHHQNTATQKITGSVLIGLVLFFLGANTKNKSHIGRYTNSTRLNTRSLRIDHIFLHFNFQHFVMHAIKKNRSILYSKKKK